MDTQLRFGPFRLLPRRRLLLDGDRPLRIGSRAFDLLVILVERAGEIIPNTELMARVWHDAVVEPGSLRMHIAALRKALGDGGTADRYIVNVPLRGYVFASPVTRTASDDPPAATAPAPVLDAPARAATLPALLTRLIGRRAAVEDLIRRLPHTRCVSLVGAGGIGKTTVALAAAHAMSASYPDGALFVELGEVTDAHRVPAALASALGVAVQPADPVQGLVAYLRDKHTLVVLDNCEHVIADVASMVERLLTAAPQVHLLITSREPMRIPGEWVQRLASLDTPEDWQGLTAAQALAFPAVQLFAERASASLDDFTLGEAEVPLVCALCHRLDGLPLAIEIAAASIDRLGLKGLTTTLGSRLSGLIRGRRTALPRHQTLRATLDWSHELLCSSEQVLFRRLSVFAAAFTFDAVRAVASDGAGDVATDLSNLVGKCLVAADISGPVVLYRLLETSREYARERLAESPEAAQVRRRHAAYVLALFTEAEGTRTRGPLAAWQARIAPSLGDLRAALAWSFSDVGDVAEGIELAAVSAPVWFDFSLMAEYRELAERALALLATRPGGPDSAAAMKIHEAYGHALWHTRGSGPAMATSFTRALEIAERLGSSEYQQRALWGLWLICNTTGDSAGSVRMAERFGRITGPGTDDSGPTHDRMLALALHFHGEQARARHHAQRVLDHQSKVNRIAQNSGFQFDQRVAALTVLARTLWIHGHADLALRHGEMAVTEAQDVGHALSLCYALANGAIPAAFWAGDLAAASRYNQLLQARATEHSLVFWQAFGEGYQLLLAPSDEHEAPTSRRTLASLTNPATSPLLLDTLCTIDGRLFDARMVERVGLSGWCAPELMRLHGHWLLQQDGRGAADAAHARFCDAFALAERQQAAGWALRCAESLARLERDQGRDGPWHARLATLAAGFTEGRDATDLRRIEALLASWPPA